MGSRKAYTYDDEKLMWEFLYGELRSCNENATNPKGYRIWEQFVDKYPDCSHSASSLATHFRKQMYMKLVDVRLGFKQILFLVRSGNIPLTEKDCKMICSRPNECAEDERTKNMLKDLVIDKKRALIKGSSPKRKNEEVSVRIPKKRIEPRRVSSSSDDGPSSLEIVDSSPERSSIPPVPKMKTISSDFNFTQEMNDIMGQCRVENLMNNFQLNSTVSTRSLKSSPVEDSVNAKKNSISPTIVIEQADVIESSLVEVNSLPNQDQSNDLTAIREQSLTELYKLLPPELSSVFRKEEHHIFHSSTSYKSYQTALSILAVTTMMKVKELNNVFDQETENIGENYDLNNTMMSEKKHNNEGILFTDREKIRQELLHIISIDHADSQFLRREIAKKEHLIFKCSSDKETYMNSIDVLRQQVESTRDQ